MCPQQRAGALAVTTDTASGQSLGPAKEPRKNERYSGGEAAASRNATTTQPDGGSRHDGPCDSTKSPGESSSSPALSHAILALADTIADVERAPVRSCVEMPAVEPIIGLTRRRVGQRVPSPSHPFPQRFGVWKCPTVPGASFRDRTPRSLAQCAYLPGCEGGGLGSDRRGLVSALSCLLGARGNGRRIRWQGGGRLESVGGLLRRRPAAVRSAPGSARTGRPRARRRT
jgi:hypothetical protein